ncbi:MAG: TetR/AcrR family transcriptional regulator [Actinomycetota bacterium]
MTEHPRVGDARPGGRAARVRDAVLSATAELLDEVGYERLSIEEVASRAGVHKTTVYRRWPTKPELVVDAVQVHSETNVPIPDTGTLEGDLRLLTRAVVANISGEGGARRSRSIVAAAISSGELADATARFWAARMAASAPIVERAVERGELPPSSDPTLLIEAAVGPLWLRLLLTGEPLDDDIADRLAELVAAGAPALGPA